MSATGSGNAASTTSSSTTGEAPDRIQLVDGPSSVGDVTVRDPSRVVWLSQTTLSVDETREIIEVLRRRFPQIAGPAREDICYATTNRQQAVREIAHESDLVIVVGSRTSSNSLRLVEVAEREGTAAYLVDDETEVDAAWLAGASTVGLSAGASAPERLVNGIIEAIDALGGAEVEERTTTTESLRFRLPQEVRS